MKKIIVSASLLFFAVAAFSQEKKNGAIYIEHPYIKVVNSAIAAYLKKDDAANFKIYADTAKVWVSGMPKFIDIKEAVKMWDSDFDYYDSVTINPVGYPDYLAYDKESAKVVQSWWRWTGKSKKTGETVKIDFVQFDDFNSAGKIEREMIYGDFSKMVKE
ncbi:hypothetical protein BH10BAC3_BH10BAC3_06380 [soil metagenome]